MVNHDASAAANLDILAEKLVAAINAIFGVHPGYRATHAKGVIYEGTFTPSKEAAAFSRAAHFQAPVRTRSTVSRSAMVKISWLFCRPLRKAARAAKKSLQRSRSF